MKHIKENLSVEVEYDFVSISDENDEIVYWDVVEWQEDPSVTISIVNAVSIALTLGAEELRKMLAK